MENEYGLGSPRVRIVSSANEFRGAENAVLAAAEGLRDALIRRSPMVWSADETALVSAVDCLRKHRAVREAAANGAAHKDSE